MEQAVAFMAGVNFLVLGLSYFFNSGDWIAWIAHLQKQVRRGSLTIGMINLLIGGFILGFHWKWEGIALVLSVVGVLATINGTIYMLFPNWLPAALDWLEPYCRAILLCASIVMVAIAAASFCEWWQLAGPAYNWLPDFNQAAVPK
jgi:hypothetical protein